VSIVYKFAPPIYDVLAVPVTSISSMQLAACVRNVINFVQQSAKLQPESPRNGPGADLAACQLR
jgi:hypothetical protein